MDKALFQFSKAKFQWSEVAAFSRDLCESLANQEELEVVKYNIDSDTEFEEVMNDCVDTDINYYRVFVCE